MTITLQEAYAKFEEFVKGKGNYSMQVSVDNYDGSSGRLIWRLYLADYIFEDKTLGAIQAESTSFESAFYLFKNQIEVKIEKAKAVPEKKIEIEQNL